MSDSARAYNRPMLIEVIVRHQRLKDGDCSCGWDVWGCSWAEHVANTYEGRLEKLDKVLVRMHSGKAAGR